jgi:hypothetical protein
MVCNGARPWGHYTGRKEGTHPALRHNHQVESRVLDLLYVAAIQLEAIVLVTHHLALRRNHQVGSKVLVLLYVATIRSEVRRELCVEEYVVVEGILLLYLTMQKP